MSDYEQWAEDYALRYEPDYTTEHEIDCKAAFEAGMEAARQAPASGEVEPVMELDISEDRCFSPILIDETLSLPAGHYKLYTHPPAKVPEGWKPSVSDYDHGIHSNPDAKAWADFFMATFPNCGADPETMHGWFANAMMAMYDHLQNTTTPDTTPETEWVKCAERVQRIRSDLEDFDGDRRGMYAALEDAEQELIEAALAATPPQEQ